MSYLVTQVRAPGEIKEQTTHNTLLKTAKTMMEGGQQLYDGGLPPSLPPFNDMQEPPELSHRQKVA